MIRATVLAVILLLAASQSVLAHADELGDIKFTRKSNAGEASDESIPPATFPHGIHRVAFKCTACHDDLYPMKAGASKISMDLIGEGKSCGVCHNDSAKVAFASSFVNCARCHR